MNPTLRIGAVGPDVLALIDALRARGYSPDSRSERFGVSVEHAVKRFQAQHLDPDGRLLDVDGIVGPRTWGALLRPCDDAQRTYLGAVQPDRIPIERAATTYKLIAYALADYDLGLRERPMGSNLVPELEARAQGKPWCDFWVHAKIKQAGGRWIFGGRRGSTRVSLRLAEESGLDVGASQVRPGDVFVLCDATGRAYHTGLVLRLEAARSRYDTIEGNSANRVAVRRRAVLSTTRFWRPFTDESFGWELGLLPGGPELTAPEQTR